MREAVFAYHMTIEQVVNGTRVHCPTQQISRNVHHSPGGPMTTSTPTTERHIWDALLDVADPEIPAISIVDLGIVHRVVVEDERIAVEIMPTFIGCPAIGIMCDEVRSRLVGFAPTIDVSVTYEENWTSDRITEQGRQNLRAAGYAPPVTPAPPIGDNLFPLALHPRVPCPFCDGTHTRLENPFGPTLCRAIYYCPDCRQPFEHFKAV
jgi:ring-1,2-phenylacetyl-CoA epoxidase subunit PaaD